MPTRNIAERLRTGARPTFSFEFFPPKDAAALDQLRDAVTRLEALEPDWVSVTYGATGSTRHRTFEAVESIHAVTPALTMGHLTVAGQSAAEVREAISSYARLGVGHILALRGDPPGGLDTRFEPHPDGLRTATELVRLIRQTGDFTVGVAAFPHGHPEGTLDLDARILLDKEEAGASFAITQLFFSVEAYLALVERFRALGGTMPIVAGIMPVTSVGQIARFEAMSGAAMPPEFLGRLQRAAAEPAAFREVGIELMTGLCDALLAAGAPGLQFFTLNRSTATTEILARLRRIPPHRS